MTASAAASGDGFTVRTLTLFELRRIWGGGSEDRDRNVLWPGLLPFAAGRLQGSRTFVVGALRDEDGFLAGRILFQRSLLDPTLWHYGYLLTHPDFRRRSLGRRLMEVGLSELLRRGARWGACYVASDNTSSLRLNARMGYLESGIVRAHVEAGEEEPGDLRILTLPERDLRRAEGGCSALVADLFGPKLVPLVAEEFLGRSSLLPWKGSPFELLRIERAGKPLGFVRLGGGVANAILATAAFEGDLWRRALSAVRRARGAARLFLFARARDREAASATAPYDHVLVLEDLRARPAAGSARPSAEGS